MRFAVAQFALSGLLAVAGLGAISVQLLRHSGTTEAINDAKRLTRLAGEAVVAPSLSPEVLGGSPAAVAGLDRIVRSRILRDAIVRVKIWDPQGRIIYSDATALIGSRFRLGADERAALATGGTDAAVSDLSAPENRLERGQHKLLEVYQGIRAPDGRRVLFEAYQRFSSVSASGERLWLSFAPALIGALVLLELAQIPLAWSLARRLRRGQREREALLQRALEASEVERQRVARDLHDGVVQNLAGVSYSLAAASGDLDHHGKEETVRRTIDKAASETRRSIRELRTLLVDLYPPDLHRTGLPAALGDLLAPMAADLSTHLRADPDLRLPPEQEALLFRVAQEALRNVSSHAGAHEVTVAAERVDGTARLTVADDGRGFDPGAAGGSEGTSHFGLRIVGDLVSGAGGRLTVDSAPGHGTRVVVEVPLS